MENWVGEKKHFVLVHGACHGAWCWYKLATLLAATGHKVTAPDLAASGVDPRRFQEVGTFSEYSRPLTEVMDALSQGERVVLFGHSFGGLSVALAMERFPEKVAAAVLVAAFLPGTSSRPSYVLEEVFSFNRGPSKPLTAFLLGPKFLSSKVYQLCPPENITLALSLIRMATSFLKDLSNEPPLSEKRYGSLKKVYVVCDQDLMIPREFQLWMTEKCVGCDLVTHDGYRFFNSHPSTNFEHMGKES